MCINIVLGMYINLSAIVLSLYIPEILPMMFRCWEIVNEYRVSKFYTAPTAIRALMKFGDDQTKVGLGIRKQIKNFEKMD